MATFYAVLKVLMCVWIFTGLLRVLAGVIGVETPAALFLGLIQVVAAVLLYGLFDRLKRELEASPPTTTSEPPTVDPK